jgi:hypothetical protein
MAAIRSLGRISPTTSALFLCDMQVDTNIVSFFYMTSDLNTNIVLNVSG